MIHAECEIRAQKRNKEKNNRATISETEKNRNRTQVIPEAKMAEMRKTRIEYGADSNEYKHLVANFE